MKIGITFSAKGDATGEHDSSANDWSAQRHAAHPDNLPDDLEEEFDSPETVHALRDALCELGHEVELLGDGEHAARRLLDGARPDLVFNIAEGRGVGRCREAWLPAFLEMLGIPYTGSDPLTLAATLDKPVAKRLVSTAGVITPSGVCVERHASAYAEELLALQMPVIIKPAFEGSSKGVRNKSLVTDAASLIDSVEELRQAYCQPVLVEEFIDGEELTVGVIGGQEPDILGIMRVVPRVTDRPFVYSIEVKRNWREEVSYECPARISPKAEAAVRRATLQAWRALGCRDVSRFDFRLRGDTPYFLEVNPLPGLSPESGDIVLLARAVGISHQELIGRIVQAAVSRASASSTNRVTC